MRYHIVVGQFYVGPVCVSKSRLVNQSARMAWRAASRVSLISETVWARETKNASNCDGGRKTPSLSIPLKNLAYRAVSEVFAEAKSLTGPSVKKAVSIEPTRLIV